MIFNNCYMNKKIAIFSFLIFILMTSSAWSATYYVHKSHQNASDSNPGTASSPWETIQKAANMLKAGDTVYVKAGVYYETVDIKNSGINGQPITFKNYNNEEVIIDGTNKSDEALVDWKKDGKTKDYIIWDGLDVRNGASNGIRVFGDNNIIQNCKIYDNGPSKNAGILLAKGDYNVVRYNECYNNRSGIMISECNNSIIENNICYKHLGKAGINFLPNPNLDPQKMWFYNVVRYNKCYDNQTGIATRFQNYLEVSNNLVYSNTKNGIYIRQHPDKPPYVHDSYSKIYNNTISKNGLNGIQNDCATHLTIKNNIFAYNSNYDIYIASGKTAGHDIDYNLYYDSPKYGWAGTQSSLSAWRAASGQGAHSLVGNPYFKNRSGNDFSISVNSEAKDMGVDLSQNGIKLDIVGVYRPQGRGFDIGAYEFNEGDAAGGSAELMAPSNLRCMQF